MQYVTSPGNVGGFFAPPNPLTGQQPVLVTSAFLNDILGNLMGVLSGAGIAPVAGNYGQVLAAIDALIAASFASAEAYAVAQANAAAAAAEAVAANDANIAQSNAEGVAASDASAAQSNAEGVAASDASAAQSNAEGVAASDASAAQSAAQSFATAILAAVLPLTNANLAPMAANTIKGNFTGVAATPQDNPIADVVTALGFTYGSNANGRWVVEPDGFITCKGSYIATLTGNQTYTITLPKPFPNSFKGGRLTSFNSAASSSVEAWPQIVTMPGSGDFSQIEIYINQQGGGGPTPAQGVSFEFFGT